MSSSTSQGSSSIRSHHDEFDFDCDESNSSLAASSIITSRSSSASNTSSSYGRQRKPLQESPPARDGEKVVRFSLSPSTTSSSSMRHGKRKRGTYGPSSPDDSSCSTGSVLSLPRFSRSASGDSSSCSIMSSTCSSLISSSSHCRRPVRGAGTDAWAVQDAGTFRELFDDLSYQCGTVQSTRRAASTEAACELALILNSKQNRAVLLSSNVALQDILDALACIKKLEGGLHNKKVFCHALAVVASLVSWDCTTNADHSSSNSPLAAAKIRNQVLQHGGALRGMVHLVLADPIVSSVLNKDGDSKNVASSQEQSETRDSDSASTDNASTGSVSPLKDPAAAGPLRRRRKRRRILLKRDVLDPIPEGGDLQKARVEVSSSQLSFTSEMSFTSNDDSSSSVSSSHQTRPDDNDSVTSSVSDALRNKLGQVKLQVVGMDDNDAVNSKPSPCRHCRPSASSQEDIDISVPLNEQSIDTMFPASVTLNALSRIIAGKQGDEVSCFDQEDHKVNGGDRNVMEPDKEENEHEDNPLLHTNRLLHQSGALPLLARAMGDTLAAVLCLSDTTNHACLGCMRHLQDRVSTLASIVDGACCLSSENRQALCSNTLLVSNLLLLLKNASDRILGATMKQPNMSLQALALLDDIALSSIRTLTSLTHDNHMAGDQLMLSYKTDSNSQPQRGLSILVDLLFRTICQRTEDLSSKGPSNASKYSLHHGYDTIIFCLNTLTNVVETKNARKVLAELELPKHAGTKNEKNSFFLQWLSKWLVSETASFRKAVMEGSFGEKALAWQASSSSDRDLEKHEEEHLVTAGNGFILLTCLMVKSNEKDSELTRHVCNTVLTEMPQGGTTLIRNTLKAFCNFYHQSVGDLSVAVVTPVRRLIEELEKI